MDSETVYRKTPLGAEAIAKRDAALVPRERSLLIMIDGHRPVGELAALGNVEEILQVLLARGLIEAVPSKRAGPPQAAAPDAAAARPAAPEPLAFPAAQRLAVRRLNDLLGPQATDLCLRLEKARTAQEFAAMVRQTEAALRQALGPQAASRFLQEFGKVRA